MLADSVVRASSGMASGTVVGDGGRCCQADPSDGFSVVGDGVVDVGSVGDVVGGVVGDGVDDVGDGVVGVGVGDVGNVVVGEDVGEVGGNVLGDVWIALSCRRSASVSE